MPAAEREIWILNFYRNSELHGALLMGRLARAVTDTRLLLNLTKHCATEARHAAMLSETIVEAGGTLDPKIPTVQEHYSSKGGVPTALADLLVLSEVLEQRVLHTYKDHLARPDLLPAVRRGLAAIVAEMEAEGEDEHAGWIDQALDAQPRAAVEAAKRKWKDVDAQVAAEVRQMVDARFPLERER
jgi:hypothetical protein